MCHIHLHSPGQKVKSQGQTGCLKFLGWVGGYASKSLIYNFWFIYNISLIFDCLLLALCNDGCSGVFNHMHVQWLLMLPSSLLRRLHIVWTIVHVELKNEIMNDNQSDHVIFVWTWHQRKQVCTFILHFINLLNTMTPMPCADIHTEALVSHFWNVFKMSCMHACLQNVQHI